MVRTASLALFCSALLIVRVPAQEIDIGREAKPKVVKQEATPAAEVHAEKAVAVEATVTQPTVVAATKLSPPQKKEPALPAAAKPTVAVATAKKIPAQLPLFQSAKDQKKITTTAATSAPAPAAAKPAIAAASKPAPPAKEQKKVAATAAMPAAAPAAVKIAKTDENVEVKAAKSQPNESPEKTGTAPKPKKDAGASVPVQNDLSPLTKPAKPQMAAVAPSGPVLPKRIDATTLAVPKMELSSLQAGGPRISAAAAPQPVSFSGDSAFIRLADGFDFPVGKPDAQGYYKARGFRSKGHLGEDWDGVGGGDTDLGDPIYSIGNGVVVFARDCHMGWGNVLIVRHSYREGGTVHNIDALYGHLQSMLVKRGQTVARGQKIATMGNAHGLYDAHLHLEIRKNLEIGMSRAAFARDFSNYYDPSTFIATHRHLSTNGGTYRVAMNTFTHDARINWDKARNYSHAHTGGGSSESAAALKSALATSSH